MGFIWFAKAIYRMLCIVLHINKVFYNYKPCCDKKSNTVGSLILGETEKSF